MQWDFAIEHAQRWLSRWSHIYYGCCEPFHIKVHFLRKIPNLRKLSVSPWCDTDKIISEVRSDYVMSRKPNPAVFIEFNCSTQQSEKNLGDFLDRTEGQYHVELIMNDISTISHEPKRLWEWKTMASGIAEEYGGY